MPANLRAAHDHNDEVLERIYIGRRFRNDTERLEKTVRDVHENDDEGERMKLQRVSYADLNSAAEKRITTSRRSLGGWLIYGFNCLRLTDDWQGADFIACHIDGETFLKVQLKGRFVLDRKYLRKDIHIAFLHRDDLFLYPHDTIYDSFQSKGIIGARGKDDLWQTEGVRTWASLPKWAVEMLAEYRL